MQYFHNIVYLHILGRRISMKISHSKTGLEQPAICVKSLSNVVFASKTRLKYLVCINTCILVIT
jgi:hypothetical protein